MFDETDDFEGDGIDFILTMKEEVEAIGDPDILSEFLELKEEAFDLFSK